MSVGLANDQSWNVLAYKTADAGYDDWSFQAVCFSERAKNNTITDVSRGQYAKVIVEYFHRYGDQRPATTETLMVKEPQ